MSTSEFALVVSLLASLAVSVLDFGIGFLEQMEVGNAARAGADYAQANGYSSTNITCAVNNATRLSVQANPPPSQFYGCPDVTSGISAVSEGTTCPSTNATAGTYVTVSAETSYSTIFTYPGISNPLTSEPAPRYGLNEAFETRPQRCRQDKSASAGAAAGNPVAERRHGSGRARHPAAGVPDVPSRDCRIRPSAVDASSAAIRRRSGGALLCDRHHLLAPVPRKPMRRDRFSG